MMNLHDLLASAVTWLEDDIDDGKSVHSHHGYYTRPDEPRIRGLSVSPQAAGGAPVFVFAAESGLNEEADDWAPWTQKECDAWVAAINEVTHVRTTWNGVGSESFSISIIPMAGNRATLPVRRYLSGCQECTMSVFCRDKTHIWRQSFRRDPPEGWG